MAKTIFDAPEPRQGRAGAAYIAAPEPMEPVEKEVAAEPRLGRAVVGYLEPRAGIDGPEYFNRCGSCVSFIPEAMMNGAVRGARCSVLGSDFPISDDDGCNLWIPYPDGKPCSEEQEEAGEEMVAGRRGSISPWDAGYKADCRRQCAVCRHSEYDIEGKVLTCGLLEEMNETLPTVFDMETVVKPGGRCDLWTPMPPPEPMS